MTQFGSDLILARLMQLHPKKIDLSLDRLKRLLRALDHPERDLPPVVHIAGTNGKGSSLAMLDAMLTAAGHRVHRYISPHLVRFNERMLIHGVPVDEALLAECLDRCEHANNGEPITFFEITTAAAFLAFNRTEADYVLLETGLGGRLDATNVVDRPQLTMISPISMDHEAFLGDTLEKIAGEKAGIIKQGVPVVIGVQHDRAMQVLLSKAEACGAPVLACGRDWSFTSAGDGFELAGRDWQSRHPRPALTGHYQFENAALAAVAARQLGLGQDVIDAGLRRVRWPGRLQPVLSGSLHERLRPGQRLWLDGGHNPAAGVALAQSLDAIAGDDPLDLVLGMLANKDAASFLEPLRGRIDRLRAVPVPDEPSSRPEGELAEVAAGLGFDAQAAPSFEDAVVELASSRPSPRTLLICGSLYLAGHVLKTVDGVTPDCYNLRG